MSSPASIEPISNLTSSKFSNQVTGGYKLTDARILVVDDSPFMVAIVLKQLGNYGFKNVMEASDGVEGLEIATKWQPDLILTDLLMPNMDGFELCQRLRSDPSFAGIPILAMTGMDKSEERTAAFSAGATDLIAKPVDHIELIGRLRVHLDRRYLIKSLSNYQKSMDQELLLARAMQESLLPSDATLADLEETYPVEIASYYEASMGLGGDLWGVVPLGKDRLKIYSADFSGHGVGAALNTFRLHTFMISCRQQTDSPAAWLAQINTFLCSSLPTGQFATMFCAIIDFEVGELTYASAGAPPQLLSNAIEDGSFRLVDGTGFPLGIFEGATFDDCVNAFPRGSGLLLYSDALIETPDPPDAVFTSEGLVDFVNTDGHASSAQQLSDNVIEHLETNSDMKPEDDLTLISLMHLT